MTTNLCVIERMGFSQYIHKSAMLDFDICIYLKLIIEMDTRTGAINYKTNEKKRYYVII